ncbi:MAG: prolyl oligopeptidase family serine peptidase [Bacteroidales bacterium]
MINIYLRRMVLGGFALTMLPSLYALEKGASLKLYGPVDIRKPILVDSTDVEEKRFVASQLLENSQMLEKSKLTGEVINSDTTYTFTWSKQGEGYKLYELHFTIDIDRYSDATLDLETLGEFKLYQNGSMVGSKLEFQDSITSKSKVALKIKLEPRTHNFILRYLSNENEKSPAIKFDFKPTDKESIYSINSGENSSRIYLSELMCGERVTSVSISPSGKYLISRYSMTTLDGKSSNYVKVSERISGKEIINESGTRVSMRWMPNSDILCYAANGVGSRELRSIDPVSLRENIMASSIPDGSFVITPDESALIFSVTQSKSKDKGDLKRLLSPDDRQAQWRTRSFIGRYDLATGGYEQLTFGHTTTSLNDIKQDGSKLLFSTSRQELSDRPFSVSSLFELDLKTGSIDTLWLNQRYAGSAKYSPDGTKLLVVASADAFEGVGNPLTDSLIVNSYDMQLFSFDISTRKAVALTKDFAPSIQSIEWNKTDNMIYALVEDKDQVAIYTINPKTSSAKKIELKEDVIRAFSMNKSGSHMAYIGQSASNFTNGYIYDIKKGSSNLFFDGTSKRLGNVELGEVKEWNFTSADGSIIEGRYYLPPNFDPTKSYPMIVYYYGGTSPTSRTLEHPYPMHLYAAQGYVVYTLNPSGTTGFGSEFAARHVNAWGKRTADEIIEGTKRFCQEHSFVDKKRVGNIGASYGGFMTMYLHTQTDIFATGISHAGISDITSYWGEGYWGYLYSSAASAKSYPWNNPELYVGQSPLFMADKVNSPLLLLHGEVDTNVPIGESIQMYNALKLLGKPVEFVRVAGEDHGIRDYARRIEWTKTILAWFDKNLKQQSNWWESMYPKSKLED